MPVWPATTVPPPNPDASPRFRVIARDGNGTLVKVWDSCKVRVMDGLVGVEKDAPGQYLVAPRQSMQILWLGTWANCDLITDPPLPPSQPHPPVQHPQPSTNPYPGMRWQNDGGGKHVFVCPVGFTRSWDDQMIGHALNLYQQANFSPFRNEAFARRRLSELRNDIRGMPAGPNGAVLIIFEMSRVDAGGFGLRIGKPPDPGPFMYPH